MCIRDSTDKVHEDIDENLHLFDTSEYPATHSCYSAVNKKRLGTFKDEMHAKPTVEFVGLRAKSYSLLVLQDDGEKTEKRLAKGVPRVTIQTRLTHADYKRCLLPPTTTRTSTNRQTYTSA